MAYSQPGWWGKAPIQGLKVREQQYRGSDGQYRPFMYDVAGLPRLGDGYQGPGGVRLDSKGRVWGQYSEGATPTGGGPSGGSFAPNLGTYGYDAAKAKLAYDRAVARINEGTQNLNRQYGFLRDPSGKTSIDPNNQYGGIQLLLRQQGQQLNQAWDQSLDRGIGHQGLGAQGETDLRFTHGQQMGDLGNQYTRGYQDLLQQKADALSEYELMQQMGMFGAIQDGDYSWGSGGGYDEYPFDDSPQNSFGGFDQALWSGFDANKYKSQLAKLVGSKPVTKASTQTAKRIMPGPSKAQAKALAKTIASRQPAKRIMPGPSRVQSQKRR